MALFRRRIKNRTFDYIPRYYDEEKEELERRLGKNQSDDPNAIKTRIRGEFKKKYRVDSRVTSSANKSANIRFLVILALIIYFAAVILNRYLPDLMSFTK